MVLKNVELVSIYRPDFLLGTHISRSSQIADNPSTEKARGVISTEFNLISVGLYQRATQKKIENRLEF